MEPINQSTSEAAAERLLNEISLPPDARPGETHESYMQRIEFEKEQKSKINNSKNQ